MVALVALVSMRRRQLLRLVGLLSSAALVVGLVAVIVRRLRWSAVAQVAQRSHTWLAVVARRAQTVPHLRSGRMALLGIHPRADRVAVVVVRRSPRQPTVARVARADEGAAVVAVVASDRTQASAVRAVWVVLAT